MKNISTLSHYAKYVRTKYDAARMLLVTKYLRPDPPQLLGRWRMDECNMKTNYKVDLTNEDHCGPCGNNRLGEKPTFAKTNSDR
jgi:hypothetical protein